MYALIGFPLSHSFSASYFNKKFKAEKINDEYILHPMSDLQGIMQWIKANPDLKGINVTIPYKESIIPYLSGMSAEAKSIGAVNVVKISWKGETPELTGFNSDAPAFLETLTSLLPNTGEIKALILGTGGASKAVAYALLRLGIDFLYVSRNPGKNMISYSEITETVMKERLLIVNTTPVGMSPNIENAPDIPYRFITPDHICYDLIYNPDMTLFLKKAQERGARIKNGLDMLHRQAEISWYIWNKT